MAKRKWNRFLELFRLSLLRNRAATRLAPVGLQSGLNGTYQLHQFDGGPAILIRFDERRHSMMAIGFLTGDY